MKTAIIIPARYASSRLPGKPLLRETGKYLVQHVFERACQARGVDFVAIATDDPRIEAAVKRFKAPVFLTRRDHPSGTDRIAEVARQIDAEIILNVQGDEPQINPASLEELVRLLKSNPTTPMATLSVPIDTAEQWTNPNCVKVVRDSQGRALYFSRCPIPYVRDGQPDFQQRPALFLQHLGVYAYRRDFLLKLASLPPDPVEQVEKLEQLRVLALGYPILVGVIGRASIGVDTYHDYQQFVSSYRNQQNQAA